MSKVISIAISLFMVSGVIGQTPIRLAYLLPSDWQVPGAASIMDACVCIGSYMNGQFQTATETSALAPDFDKALVKTLMNFSVGQTLLGIAPTGRKLRAVVDKTDPDAISDVGFPTLTVRVRSKQGLSDGALLMTSTIILRLLHRRSASLGAGVEYLLHKRAQELWNRHLQERAYDERPTHFTLKRPIVERIDELPDVIVVRFPMDIVERDLNGDGRTGHDDRGQMFFIYSTTDRRIIREEFGHPEWAPGSTVRTITPRMYFRVEASNSVYFIGENSSGWESGEFALFDLRTGREILKCL
ncbi:MAG: hypothetical protein IPM66_14655 [Acidobacteriota bacterium]|nr:MAG: hypothetical protein IPM66_14655 [Acidobacteriota bacterium]